MGVEASRHHAERDKKPRLEREVQAAAAALAGYATNTDQLCAEHARRTSALAAARSRLQALHAALPENDPEAVRELNQARAQQERRAAALQERAADISRLETAKRELEARVRQLEADADARAEAVERRISALEGAYSTRVDVRDDGFVEVAFASGERALLARSAGYLYIRANGREYRVMDRERLTFAHAACLAYNLVHAPEKP